MARNMYLSSKGDFSKTEKFLKSASTSSSRINLNPYGKRGVAALAAATPTDSGLTASSWAYKIEKQKGKSTLIFYNTNIQNGVPIAIILQYGHGTKNGGWVEGRDYINPAIRPIFDDMAKAIWKEVKGK